MTYAELIVALGSWVESAEAELVAQYDFMIELAEKRIYRSIDLENGWKYSSVALVQGTELVTLPTDSVVVRAVEYMVDSTTAEPLYSRRMCHSCTTIQVTVLLRVCPVIMHIIQIPKFC